ncbi:DREB2A-interacting protein 2 isoform 2 [Hibiscus syriacus]|uniref:DREB2A-interacting protein 2 isoform 2 n=1 Tax=Hibiscus syriacus TaxID=106335 RepID=A0A6A2X8F0_HIBSY|nr:DREB2A-interacting protein 2 isoform 2 [Hibiscus syriacus]
MANQVVKVKREAIAACMTCPLCNKLLRDATTISECLHTLLTCSSNSSTNIPCLDKLTIEEEELECCPICNIDLGCVPLEKLRPDHNLQDVRAKIFPLKRRKVKTPEVVPPVTMPARRKERSLSSLVVNAPKVLSHTAMTGRRTKAFTRKAGALRHSTFSIEKPVKKDEDSMEDNQESASSPETLNKFTQNKRQCTSSAEHIQHMNKEAENGGEAWDGKLDLWKPLTCLVEVANRTKSFKSNSQGSDSKLEPTRVPNIEAQMCKSKHREDKCKTKVEDEKSNAGPATSESAVLDAAGPKHERRIGPVWFSLVASEDQCRCFQGRRCTPPANFCKLPEDKEYGKGNRHIVFTNFTEEVNKYYPGGVSEVIDNSSYIANVNGLRVEGYGRRQWDGNMPVSFIKKYLKKKLNLTDEAEVEIKCMGQPVVPTLQLYNLVDLWLQTTATSQRVPATLGSSAKEFVMVLAYSRKVQDE